MSLMPIKLHFTAIQFINGFRNVDIDFGVFF